MSNDLLDLPEGWEWVNIGEVTIPYQTIQPNKTPQQQFQYIDISSIDNSSQTITNPKVFLGKDAPSRARRVVKKDDVVFSTVRTYLKNIARVPFELDGVLTSTGIAVLRAGLGIDSNFLFYSVNSDQFIQKISSSMDGTLYPAVTDSDISDAKIPLPPLNEQKRIVAKIEELNDRSQTAQKALETIPQLCDRFRQSVLAAAFRGDLTADWREKNPDVEPASVLLERIKKERLSQKVNKPVNLSELPELPDGWLWVLLEDIATHKSGIAFKSQEFTNDGIQVIRLGNVYKGKLDLTREPVFLSDEYSANNFTLKPGDIVVSQTGTRFKRDYGYFVLIPENSPELFLNQRLLAVSCNNSIIPEYIVFASQLKIYQDHFFSHETGGVNQGNVGVSGVMKGVIPLASQEEAQVIVSRIKSAFEYINNLQSKFEQIYKELEKLNQSILSKAFRGELVPQDPEDEPASVLLARIRAEREKLNNNKPKSTSKRKGKTPKEQGTIPGLE